MARVPHAALLPLLAAGGAGAIGGRAGGSTDLSAPHNRCDVQCVRQRFNKKTLKQLAVVGYLPTEDAVKKWYDVSAEMGDVLWYHISDRSMLDALGHFGKTTKDMLVAVYRPWNPKKFKVTFKGDIGFLTKRVAQGGKIEDKESQKFMVWLSEALHEPGSYAIQDIAYELPYSARVKNIPILRAFLMTDLADQNDKKPDGWDDIPEKIPDPEATQPEDWDEDDDGAWSASDIPNPKYQGAWTPKRLDTRSPIAYDVKPDDWDQPEIIVDHNSLNEPAGWDAEEDGPWDPPRIPNPAYRDKPWVQLKMPPLDQVTAMREKLAPFVKKYAGKLYVTIEDANIDNPYASGAVKSYTYKRPGHDGFNDTTYLEGNAITFEKYNYIWDESRENGVKGYFQAAEYVWPIGTDLATWVDDAMAGKLVSLDRLEKRAKKAERLAKQKAEGDKKDEL